MRVNDTKPGGRYESGNDGADRSYQRNGQRRRKWQERILSCQESGKTVTAWCEENGIAASTYYRKLRKMREEMLSSEQQIVPLKPRTAHGIRITAGEINIAMPEDADPEQLKAIIEALKTC